MMVFFVDFQQPGAVIEQLLITDGNCFGLLKSYRIDLQPSDNIIFFS